MLFSRFDSFESILEQPRGPEIPMLWVCLPMQMKLSHLSDSSLLIETQRLCGLERRTTLQILHHLREIEARALFAKTHSSLFEFCIKELGFSEDQASRRIRSMRLLKSVPEIEHKVASGELKVSQLAQVQTFIRTEKKEAGRVISKDETRSLLLELSGKSSRETERVLLEKSPALQAKRQAEEKLRPVTATHTEVKFVADAELMQLLDEAKGLSAHNGNMNPSFAEVLKKALRVFVEQKKRQQGLQPSTGHLTQGSHATSTVLKGDARPEAAPARELCTAPAEQVAQTPLWGSAARKGAIEPTRYIVAQEKRITYRRAQGRCEFISSTGQRCSSKHALEFHHVRPFALGGENTARNLKLYCRVHNAAQGKWDFPAWSTSFTGEGDSSLRRVTDSGSI